MTDAFEAQGEFAPVQSATHNEFTAAADTVSEARILEALDAAAPEAAAAEEPAAPNGFIKLGLAPELIAAVADMGFTQPTAVQEKVVPIAMGDQDGAAKSTRFVDLMVSSQTGSGKTAAFLLPVLHTLIKQRAVADAAAKAEFERLCAEAAAKGEPAPKRNKRKDPTNARNFKAAVPGALVLCPTRELAQQVAHDAIELVKHCRGIRIANVVGGIPYQLQIAKLQRELYGPKRERSQRLIAQMELGYEDLETGATEDEIAAEQASAKTSIGPYTRKRPSRKPFPAHLPLD